MRRSSYRDTFQHSRENHNQQPRIAENVQTTRKGNTIYIQRKVIEVKDLNLSPRELYVDIQDWLDTADIHYWGNTIIDWNIDTGIVYFRLHDGWQVYRDNTLYERGFSFFEWGPETIRRERTLP